MPTTAHSADQAVDDLRQFISKGEYGLGAVPSIVEEIIRKDYWKERVVQSSGEIAAFDDFKRFICDRPPAGVGSNMETVLRMCREKPTVIDLIDRVTQRRDGDHTGNQYTIGTVDDIHSSAKEKASLSRPSGTDKRTALRRLRKDRPDLHERVLAGELTPHGAMVEAGFRPRAYRMPTTVPGLVEAVRRHFTPEQIAELVRLLGAEP